MIQKKDNNELSVEKIRQFVIYWNTTYPIDFWWRAKHSIAFGSKKHKAQSMLDMRIEFEEDQLVKEQEMSPIGKKYSKGRGDWLNKRPEAQILTEERAEDIFENLDIGALQLQDIEKMESGEKGDNSITIKKR